MAFILIILLIIAGIIAVAVLSIKALIRGRSARQGFHRNPLEDIVRSREEFLSQAFLLTGCFALAAFFMTLNSFFGKDIFRWEYLFIVIGVGMMIAAYRTRFPLIFPFAFFTAFIGWMVLASEVVQGRGANTHFFTSILGVAGLMLLSGILYFVGHRHPEQHETDRLAFTQRILGVAIATGALFFFSVQSGIEFLQSVLQRASLLAYPLPALLVFFLFLGAFVWFAVLSTQERKVSVMETLFFSVLSIVFLVLIFQPGLFLATATYPRILTVAGTGLIIFFNLLLFFELVGMIWLGYTKHQARLVSSGSYLLFLFIIVKYFDWFVSFLSKSAFFIWSGLFLIALGWFMEKGRRYLVTRMKEESSLPSNQNIE